MVVTIFENRIAYVGRAGRYGTWNYCTHCGSKCRTQASGRFGTRRSSSSPVLGFFIVPFRLFLSFLREFELQILTPSHFQL